MKTVIEKVAVIGAGTMGAAIAQHFLMKNLDVLLVDLQQQSIDKGLSTIEQSLQDAVQRGILSTEKKTALLSNLTCSIDYTQLQDRELVVEAVFEDIEVKTSVFRQIESQVADHCIIASNTSSLSITELSSALRKPNRFLGVHYFYHAAKNKLIELIPGEKTSKENIELLYNFYWDNDKAPIIVADVHGFAVNRFFVPWLNEAVRLYEEGIASIAFIDQVARDVFNVGMGPFALMNATGIPITLHAANTLKQHFGEMYAPAKKLIEQIEKQQDWDLASTEYAVNKATVDKTATDEHSPNTRQQVTDRLLAMSLGIAAQMVSEGVTGVTETDLGARLGLRWPLGPFELINQQGIGETEAVVKRAFEKYGQPVPTVFHDVDDRRGFKIEHVRAHVIGTTGLIEFYRPDAMNALNPEVIQCLSENFDLLADNADIEKIIFFGRGKAFVAGADIKFFIDHIEAGTLEAVYDFTRQGQAVLAKIAQSKKQTIAYLDGLTLGGGLELALACDDRIATSRLMAAFPETGIGIYPGLGGTQRTPRIIGKAYAKYLIATGATVNAEQALACGLVSGIVHSTNKLEDIACLGTASLGTASLDMASLNVDNNKNVTAINNSDKRVFEAFNGELTDSLFDEPELATYKKMLSKKAPMALKKAMQLVDRGAALPLDQALQLELDHLIEIFSSKDAYTGLTGVIDGSKSPVFIGE